MSRIKSFKSLDDFLEEEGISETVNANAMKRVLAMELEDAMRDAKLSKSEMAKRMDTSRAQLDRILSKDGGGMTLETIIKAAHAVGRRLEMKLI
jgi:antitoxin HicB